MSKILVIGNGVDPLGSKRGGFIDEYFDEVLIVRYAVCFLDEFKEYIGTPTILMPSQEEWRRVTCLDLRDAGEERDAMRVVYDADNFSTFRDRVYDCIKESNIHTIIRCFNMRDPEVVSNPSKYLYPYDYPKFNKKDEAIFVTDDSTSRGTSGIKGLHYAIDNYDEVCYMGLGGDKSYISEDGRVIRHFYGELEEFNHCNHCIEKPLERIIHPEQYFVLKRLESQHGIKHIDKVFRKWHE